MTKPIPRHWIITDNGPRLVRTPPPPPPPPLASEPPLDGPAESLRILVTDGPKALLLLLAFLLSWLLIFSAIL